MNNFKIRYIPAAAFIFVLLLNTAARASVLRMITTGGPESAFGIITFSESDTNLMRPADLVSLERGNFTFTQEYEQIINQKKGDVMLNLGTARKKRAEFFYPLNRNPKYRSAIGFNLYSSNLKFMTNDKLDQTNLYDKGFGTSGAFAQQVGRITFGFYRNNSGNNGIGSSGKINDWVNLLDADSDMITSLSVRREGYHIKGNVNKRLSAGYLREAGDIRAIVNFKDAEDDLILPAIIGAERRELSMSYKMSKKYSTAAFFNHGSFDNLNRIEFNSIQAGVGSWLSKGEFDSRSFYLKKSSSRTRIMVLGYEDYDGYFRIAGVIDPLDSVFWAPYYLYHSSGFLHRNTYKYSIQKKKGNYTYRFMYAYSEGYAFLHYDSALVQAFFSSSQKSWESINYDYKQYQIGFGLEKEIHKDVLFRYSLLQAVPILEDVEEDPFVPGGGGPTEKKKTRGGTVHLFSIIYLL